MMRRTPNNQPGIAMLLVLVALLITTVLVGATLTSRENSPAIGMNASSAAGATWSAESAANFAVGAIAQADDVSLLLGGDDTLTQSMTINGADLDVKVTDLDGDAPAPEDRELIVRALASINGIDKLVEKRITKIASGDATDAADPYLLEFAIFATQRIEIQSAAAVGVWDLSPEANTSGGLAKIGVGFTNAADCNIDPSSVLRRTILYTDADASLALEALAAAAPADLHLPIAYDVPTLPSARPSSFNLLPDDSTTTIQADASILTLATPAHYDALEILNNATITIDDAGGSFYRFQRIRALNNSSLVVRGDIRILVNDTVEFNDSKLVLGPGASATIYVVGNLDLDNNAKIGVTPADALTPPAVISEYVDPRRLRILALAPTHGGHPDPQWTIRNQAAAIAIVHNPLGRLDIQSNAALYGHAVARDFRLNSGCSLSYCPILDSRLGYSSATGPLYDTSGIPIPELVTIIDDAATLTTAEGFANKLRFDYDALISAGTLTEAELSGGSTKLITETTDLGSGTL